MDKSDYVRLLKEPSINDEAKFVPVSLERPRTRGRPLKHYRPLLQKEKELSSVVQRILPKAIADSVIQKGSGLAHLYGPPKTHKKKLAMRPLLSATGTYNYKLAKWLDEKLKPLSINDHTVSDIFQFADELHEMKINDQDIFVSYDVSSLFTNVPVDETIESIAERAFETENKMPAFYKRYVDDTLSAMPGVETASDFLTTLNNTHPSIDFTMELEVNGRLPFLGMDIIRNGCRLDTKVYRKPTDTGLLLHYHSHVDGRYKRSLLNTMFNRALKLSSTWELFHQECERLKVIFSCLYYPDKLVQSTIRQFVAFKVSEESQTQQQVPDNNEAPIRIVLPFKDQKSADALRRQLADLSRKINATISPVYTSQKIKDEIKVREDKPPLVNQQCVVCHFQCNLCDAGYVGYTCRHLHQRIEEHKGTAIGNHLKDEHNMSPNDIARNFKISRKCQNKLDCLIFEMLFIKELKPTLNKQCDSIRAKLFV